MTFDSHDGFYFSDLGSCINYPSVDVYPITPLVEKGIIATNGIVLSPDKKVYESQNWDKESSILSNLQIINLMFFLYLFLLRKFSQKLITVINFNKGHLKSMNLWYSLLSSCFYFLSWLYYMIPILYELFLQMNRLYFHFVL